MCGILGKVSANSNIDKDLFDIQCKLITHRGPDDSGIWISDDNRVALGSRRLAIQDLTFNGHMPMLNSDKSLIIAFNGEIYNYPTLKIELINHGYEFRTSSDTEVVLFAYQEWGTECLNKLNGMFSISIYDKLKNLIFLARDRAGEKPLYYKFDNDGLEFASELKVLLADPSCDRNLNLKCFENYLKFGYSLTDQSMVDGINKLEAGNYLIYNISKNKVEIKRYWNLPEFNNQEYQKTEALVDKLDKLLSESVKRQLISDVPIGVLLSGGVDSSLITAYAAEHSTGRIKTFNISFEGFGKFNESNYAKIVSQYFGTEHIELSGNDISFEIIDQLIEYFDEPLADSSMIPTFLLSSQVKKHVTVALGGDGGDELFGGYSNYKSLLKFASVKKNIPKIFRDNIGKIIKHIPSGIKGKNFLLNFSNGIHDSFNIEKFFHDSDLNNILSDNYKSKFLKRSFNLPICDFNTNDDPIYVATSYDFKHYMCEDILVKVDRSSMANSLELRAPWLDKDLIEFAFSEVPSSLKANENRLKILPKLLSAKKLPADLNIERKQGFSIPINNWLRDKWYQDFKLELIDLPREIFNTKYILNQFENSKYGLSNQHKFYSLIILNKWLKKYKIKF